MNRKVSVAPMMDCTDRHERFFLRLISKNTLLYTEMIVDEAINRGDKKKLLEFNINEKPVALQLGGSSPKLLSEAAPIVLLITHLSMLFYAFAWLENRSPANTYKILPTRWFLQLAECLPQNALAAA